MGKFKIVFTQDAISQIKHISTRYNELSKGLGKRFQVNLKKELAVIKKNPFLRSIRYEEVRFAVVKKFPYAAHYTIENDIIIIHAVFGFKEDPEKWINK